MGAAVDAGVGTGIEETLEAIADVGALALVLDVALAPLRLLGLASGSGVGVLVGVSSNCTALRRVDFRPSVG